MLCLSPGAHGVGMGYWWESAPDHFSSHSQHQQVLGGSRYVCAVCIYTCIVMVLYCCMIFYLMLPHVLWCDYPSARMREGYCIRLFLDFDLWIFGKPPFKRYSVKSQCVYELSSLRVIFAHFLPTDYSQGLRGMCMHMCMHMCMSAVYIM